MNIILLVIGKLFKNGQNHIFTKELKFNRALYMRISLLLLTGFGIINSSTAQEKQNRGHIELEVDPIAYILSGFSFHTIYVKNKIRTDVGVFGILQPEGFGGNEGFRVKTKGTGLKINYLLDKKKTWFAGLGFGYSNNNIEFIETKESQIQNSLGVGIHSGYRWFMFNKSEKAYKNFYLAPWASIDYNFSLNEVEFESRSYTQKPVTFFPTVHVGYKF